MSSTEVRAASSKTVTREYRWLGRVPYAEALALQEDLVAARRENRVPDTVLFLEHEPVYTIGKRPDQSSLRTAKSQSIPVFEISRGGQATYHGPGQLIAYPILDLRSYGRDLHIYLRALEDGILKACRAMGLAASRRESLTGAWVQQRKIASIGVGVRRWISMHGAAVNIGGDLSPFQGITPCGIDGVEMTSLERELGINMSVERAAKSFEPHLETALARLVLPTNPGSDQPLRGRS